MKNNERLASVSGAMPADLKIINRIAILDVYRDGSEHTAHEISEMTGISRQTVMKAIKFFLEKGVLTRTGKGASTEIGGKRPDVFRIAVSKLLLSITMWPESLILTLSNMHGSVIGFFRSDEPISQSPHEAFRILQLHVQNILNKHNHKIEDIYGVTLSISGIVSYDEGLLIHDANAPGWETNVPLKQYLNYIFGDNTVIIIENSGRMASRAELSVSENADKRVIVIFSTWGLSACFFENGRVLGDHDSLVGEIGHMIVDPNDNEICGCGSRGGCLEKLVSAKRIQMEIAARPLEHATSALSGINPESVTFPELFKASEQGDSLARSIVEKLSKFFAIALRNIALSFNPDIVVFQGNYSYADEFFQNNIKKELATFKYLPPEGSFEMQFDQRPLHQLDLMGSLAYLHDEYYSNPKLYQD